MGEKVAQYLRKLLVEVTNLLLSIQMTPGQRDFYFVANLLPDMKEAFKAVSLCWRWRHNEESLLSGW